MPSWNVPRSLGLAWKWPPLSRRCQSQVTSLGRLNTIPKKKEKKKEGKALSGTPQCPLSPRRPEWASQKVRTTLIAFFDIKGLVHHEFVPHGTTINAKFYVQVLKRLKQRVHCVRPDIARDWKLHYDNATAHTTFPAIHFLVDSKVPMVPQPPYSPDMTPQDLLSALKSSHERTSFWYKLESNQAWIKAPRGILEEAYCDAFYA